MNRTPTRYDLLACNLLLTSVAALLMAAVGNSVKVVQVLEGAKVAGFDINLGFGAAVNPGVLTASVVILFSMTTALLCVIHNRLRDQHVLPHFDGCLQMARHHRGVRVLRPDAGSGAHCTGSRGRLVNRGTCVLGTCLDSPVDVAPHEPSCTQ